MQDRVPLYPGRVKLTPVSGQENVYDMVRADQPTQEGTPLNKASLLTDATAALFGLGTDAVPDDILSAIRGPSAVTKTYPVADGQTIQAGDVVDIVDGTAKMIIKGELPTTKAFANGLNAKIKVLSDDLAIVAYADSRRVIYVALMKPDTGEIVSDFTEVMHASSSNSVEMTVISKTKVAIILHSVYYRESRLYIVSIEGTSFTIFDPVTLITGETAHDRCVALSETRIAVFGNSQNTYGIRVDLYDITESTAKKVGGLEDNSFSTILSNGCVTLISGYGESSQKLFCAYIDKSTTHVGSVIVSVNGTSVSFGESQILIPESSYNFSNVSACYLRNGYIIFAPSKAGKTYLFSLYILDSIISVKASNIEFGIPGSSVYGFVPIGANEVVVLSAQVSNVAFTTMTVGDQITWTDLVSLYFQSYSPYFDMLPNEDFIVVLRSGSSSLVKSIVQRRGSSFGGSFTNNATQAIALQSGDAGDTIEVIYAGTVFADWVTQNQQIISNGVKATGILPGVLQVLGINSPGGKVITGTYTGTGSYGEANPNKLQFEMPLRFLWIYATSKSGSITGVGGLNSGWSTSTICIAVADVLTEEYLEDAFGIGGNGILYAKLIDNKKTFMWYQTYSAENQFNTKDTTYHYLAVL